VLAVAIAAQSADAQETHRCVLTAPKYQAKGSEVVFEITIDCGSTAANAKPFPIGEEILVGLTVYADKQNRLRNEDDYFSRRVIDAAPEVEAALKRTTQSQSVVVAGGPKWIVLQDAEAPSYDLPAQVIRLAKDAKRSAVQFQTDQKAITGKQHYLFAAWAASERKPCDRKAKFARSGCKRNGYVIGDDSGVWPIAAYPGMEINEFVHPNGEEWTAERWIVERFR
jgi:hypothetical protein